MDEFEKLKAAGNKLFAEGNYIQAYELYTQAIAAEKSNAAIYSNRSLTLMKLDRLEEAVNDASEAIKIDNTYGKAYYRRSCAYRDLAKSKKDVSLIKIALADARKVISTDIIHLFSCYTYF